MQTNQGLAELVYNAVHSLGGRLEEVMNGDLHIGTWLVQPGLNTISQNGITRQLEPKVMEVLVCLARHAGQTLAKEQLLQMVWKDTFVSDDALARSISEIRRAFEDDARESKVIQTVAKRGYRLIATVRPMSGNTGLAADAPQAADKVRKSIFSRNGPRIGIAIGFTAALLLALLALRPAVLRRKPAGNVEVRQIHSLAVLPLANLSNDPNQEYFSDGLTDALITDLAQVGSVNVSSRTSTMRYKATKQSLPEIARELNVDGIVEGTVQRSGDRVRITAQLIHGPSDKHLWANSYERDAGDVFALERNVTEDIAHQIQVQVTSNAHPRRAQQPLPMNAKALEAYLQGNYHVNKQGAGFGDEEKKKAAKYFEEAIAADPNFSPSYDGLVYSHELLLLGSSEDVAASRQAAEKAMEIDPDDWHARVLFAALKWIPDLDWRGAEEGYRQAIALNPNAASPRSALCILLVVLGRVDEGLRDCRIAQRLDPFDDDSALGLYLGRDYDGSITMVRMLLQRDPNVGLWRCYLFPNYVMKGMYKESIQELEQCYALYGFPEAAANIRHAFGVSGFQGAIRQWAKETEQLQVTHRAFLPGYLAQAYAILGNKDRAFYWLEQAYEHREVVSFDSGVFGLGAEPMYDPLRSDPRFKDLLRRTGLPQ